MGVAPGKDSSTAIMDDCGMNDDQCRIATIASFTAGTIGFAIWILFANLSFDGHVGITVLGAVMCLAGCITGIVFASCLCCKTQGSLAGRVQYGHQPGPGYHQYTDSSVAVAYPTQPATQGQFVQPPVAQAQYMQPPPPPPPPPMPSHVPSAPPAYDNIS